MSDKYIIRNCPAFLDDVQLLEFSEGTCNSLQNHRTYCQDCTDCVMKQIVEKCSKAQEYHESFIRIDDILDDLDIQEVE